MSSEQIILGPTVPVHQVQPRAKSVKEGILGSRSIVRSQTSRSFSTPGSSSPLGSPTSSVQGYQRGSGKHYLVVSELEDSPVNPSSNISQQRRLVHPLFSIGVSELSASGEIQPYRAELPAPSCPPEDQPSLIVSSLSLRSDQELYKAEESFSTERTRSSSFPSQERKQDYSEDRAGQPILSDTSGSPIMTLPPTGSPAAFHGASAAWVKSESSSRPPHVTRSMDPSSSCSPKRPHAQQQWNPSDAGGRSTYHRQQELGSDEIENVTISYPSHGTIDMGSSEKDWGSPQGDPHNEVGPQPYGTATVLRAFPKTEPYQVNPLHDSNSPQRPPIQESGSIRPQSPVGRPPSIPEYPMANRPVAKYQSSTQIGPGSSTATLHDAQAANFDQAQGRIPVRAVSPPSAMSPRQSRGYSLDARSNLPSQADNPSQKRVLTKQQSPALQRELNDHVSQQHRNSISAASYPERDHQGAGMAANDNGAVYSPGWNASNSYENRQQPAAGFARSPPYAQPLYLQQQPNPGATSESNWRDKLSRMKPSWPNSHKSSLKYDSELSQGQSEERAKALLEKFGREKMTAQTWFTTLLIWAEERANVAKSVPKLRLIEQALNNERRKTAELDKTMLESGRQLNLAEGKLRGFQDELTNARTTIQQRDAEIARLNQRLEDMVLDNDKKLQSQTQALRKRVADLTRDMAAYGGNYRPIMDDVFAKDMRGLMQKITNFTRFCPDPKYYQLGYDLDPDGYLQRQGPAGGWIEFIKFTCWAVFRKGFFDLPLGFGSFGNQGPGFQEIWQIRRLFSADGDDCKVDPRPNQPSDGSIVTLTKAIYSNGNTAVPQRHGHEHLAGSFLQHHLAGRN